MRRWSLSILAMLLLGISVFAQETETVTLRASAPNPEGVKLSLVANGFFRPVALTTANDGSGRFFIVEQSGRIWIMQDGQILPDPFLNITDRVSQSSTRGYSELGLLGLAFDPDFSENATFYVHYNDRDNTSIISQFKLSDDDNLADKASEAVLLTMRQPFANHNGGEIAFGPDGYLYVSFGDGGSQGDPNDTGQDPSDWFASILRIDPDGEGAYAIPETNPYFRDPSYGREVWAYGLRNAWRFSFDRATGDMYVADVGQNVWEEVNFQPADSLGGVNYGWSDYEASAPYAVGTAPANMTYPFFEYAHQNGRCSVTGGYVYRGEAVPDLDGVYLFGDYCTGEIWASWRDLNGDWQSELFLSAGFSISTFGQDERGEMYVADHSGDIYRIDPS